MCALCAIWHFSDCLADNVHLQDVRARVHTISVFGWIRATLPLAACRFRPLGLPLAVQRYDTKTILTNFWVKISQWNVFLGRRRCAIQDEGGAIRVIIVMVSATWYGRRLCLLQGEAYANRSYPFHWLIFACLHAGWPPMPCLHTRPFHMQCAPPARDLTNFNITHDFRTLFVKKMSKKHKEI